MIFVIKNSEDQNSNLWMSDLLLPHFLLFIFCLQIFHLCPILAIIPLSMSMEDC